MADKKDRARENSTEFFVDANKKIQIMHVRDSSGIYGGERVILTLGNKLNKDLFDFKLLCMQRPDVT